MNAARRIGPVYRGEHGGDAPVGGFHTRRPSISFGSHRAAEIYSQSPNDREMDMRAASPRVIRAFLRISNPLVDQPDDPFVDASILAGSLGNEATLRLLRRHASFIHNTNNWEEKFAGRYRDATHLIDDDPVAAIAGLYIEIYPLLDDPEVVDRLRQAGFDGAIYGGSGETAGETEWRVFDPAQVRVDRVFHQACRVDHCPAAAAPSPSPAIFPIESGLFAGSMFPVSRATMSLTVPGDPSRPIADPLP